MENVKTFNETFLYGVEDTFELKDSEDIMVIGKIKGTARLKMGICIVNNGDDDAEVYESLIEAIDNDGVEEYELKDSLAGLRIKNGKKYNIKTGTVLYSVGISRDEIHNAYIQALGDGYISFRHMELGAKEYERMSLTDLCEVRRLFKWLIGTKKDQETEEIAKANNDKLETIGIEMCKKLFAVEEIYAVINKRTGEPHMFSKTFDRGDGNYVCSPPDIMLVTKAYVDMYRQMYNPDRYELVRIETGEDGANLYNFLGSTFYLNGACGVCILFDDYSINAETLVKKPDYSNIPKIQIPVTNPDLERWLLLIGQMESKETPDEVKVYSLYLSFMFRELAKAMLLIPMKMDGEMTPPDEEGNCITKQGSTISLATMEGKNGRDAIRMFTDWKRFRMVYTEEDGWGGMIETIPGTIERFDCAINATMFASAGCYISEDAYENDIKRWVDGDK